MPKKSTMSKLLKRKDKISIADFAPLPWAAGP